VFAPHASIAIAKKTAKKTPVFPSLISDSPRIYLIDFLLRKNRYKPLVIIGFFRMNNYSILAQSAPLRQKTAHPIWYNSGFS
jgi:hypothetical protein